MKQPSPLGFLLQLAMLIVLTIIALPLIFSETMPPLLPLLSIAGIFGIMAIFAAIKISGNWTFESPDILPPPTQEIVETHVQEVGIIAFWDAQNAYVFRTQSIPDIARTIQPYLQLKIRNAASIHIRFEIYDTDEKLVFDHEVQPTLVQATNLILPPAHLPVDHLARDKQWSLRIRVNTELVSTHYFHWRGDQVENLEGSIESDGEIDESVLVLLADNYVQPLSLDDLLASGDKMQPSGV